MTPTPNSNFDFFGETTQDSVACQVIAISVNQNKAYLLRAIESFTTSKTDQSDPGSFSVSGPLTEPSNLEYFKVSSPMDIIAIYARRIVDNDSPSIIPKSPIGPNANVNVSQLTYGGPADGSMTRMLQSDTLVFLGVVDDPSESYQISESPTSTMTLSGSDFTKFLNCNDVVIPYSIATTAVFLQSSFGFNTTEKDIAAFMLLILDTLVSKTAISTLTGNDSLTSTPQQIEAELGFPYREFISTANVVPYFPFHAQTEQYIPRFQVQSGSAWANLVTLKNEPLSRLFITEDGEFLVDDALYALVAQPAISFKIYPTEVSGNASFSRDDANVATFVSIYGAQTQIGNFQSFFGGVLTGATYQPGLGVPVNPPFGITDQVSTQKAVQKFGVRQAQYQATFDTFTPEDGTSDTPVDDSVRRRLQSLILLLHNSLDILTLTVKGRSFYRVGTRIFVNVGFVRDEVSYATWYVCGVSHQFTFGAGWTTTLQLRFPQAPNANVQESGLFS